MTCRSSTRNPVQVRAVQFYSSLVDTNRSGQVWRDRGRVLVRPATVIGLGRPRTNHVQKIRPAAASANMSRMKCHALLSMLLTKSLRHRICCHLCHRGFTAVLDSQLTNVSPAVLHTRVCLPYLCSTSDKRTNPDDPTTSGVEHSAILQTHKIQCISSPIVKICLPSLPSEYFSSQLILQYYYLRLVVLLLEQLREILQNTGVRGCEYSSSSSKRLLTDTVAFLDFIVVLVSRLPARTGRVEL